jgi:hypothetical protein
MPTGVEAAAGYAPVLAHTLSLQVTVAILKPTYSKKKTQQS